MYIDSLTIVAGAVFFMALGVFIRFCIVKTCGLLPSEEDGSVAEAPHEKGV